MATAAPAKAPARKAPARKAPARKAPARKSPAKKSAGAARARGVPAARPHLVPLAVGHTAAAVRGLPDCRPVVGLTRGRAWIGLLGLLLAGIVALNVVTLNLTATAGDIEAQRQTLREENSLLQRRLAERLSNGRVEGAAASLGFERPDGRDINFATAGPEAVKIAAERLAALD